MAFFIKNTSNNISKCSQRQILFGNTILPQLPILVNHYFSKKCIAG